MVFLGLGPDCWMTHHFTANPSGFKQKFTGHPVQKWIELNFVLC